MSDGLVAALERQAAAWSARPLVRRLYREWHELLAERVARIGEAVEEGRERAVGGGGRALRLITRRR